MMSTDNKSQPQQQEPPAHASSLSLEQYPIGLVPGPTALYPGVAAYYQHEYGSPDLEERFVQQYVEAQKALRELLRASDEYEVVIQSGEAMVCLWGALKSVLRVNDHVFSIGTGVYGYGIADMARSLGAEVTTYGFDYDDTVKDSDMELITRAAKQCKPHLITVVHCDTPSGTLNPIAQIGELAKRLDALLYVDFVSSAAACELRVTDWHIDLGLLGSQKALSLPPDLGIVTISPRAMKRIEEVKYVGYDALLQWKTADAIKSAFPYTHNWRAVSALHYVTRMLLDKEGLDEVIKRHREVSTYCRTRIKEMGLRIFPRTEQGSSPSVTAVYMPENWTWQELDRSLRQQGVVFGGSYGKLANKVFRIGHMGSQARMDLVKSALDVLSKVLLSKV